MLETPETLTCADIRRRNCDKSATALRQVGEHGPQPYAAAMASHMVARRLGQRDGDFH